MGHRNCGSGIPGSNNYLTILDSSLLFTNHLNGQAPKCRYTINGNNHDQGYYLCNGICPEWSALVKTINQPQGLEKKHFTKMQETCRKDIKRALGVLQAWSAIVSQPAQAWSNQNLQLIMKACIILHNMIVEDELKEDLDWDYDGSATVSVHVEQSKNGQDIFSQFITNFHALRNVEKHNSIRNDLIKHLWALKGQSHIE